MDHVATRKLSGWGNFNPVECRLLAPPSRQALREIVRRKEDFPQLTMRGLGRSYGDPAVDDAAWVVDLRHFDRIVAFDRETGRIRVESGVSLEELIKVILPSGWFLPTTPGTKFVSVGGAVAADVHGKNHHVDGSLGNWIKGLKLLTAAGEEMNCSPDGNPELFWATIGGMGLTGIILEAEIQLVPYETSYFNVHYKKCSNLDDAMAELVKADKSCRYSVGWVDTAARGNDLGRCVLMLGTEAKVEDLNGKQQKRPREVASPRKFNIPVAFPNFALNRYVLSGFNRFYYAVHRDRTEVTDYDTYFYPLDAIHNWNRVYGRRGFIQYQAFFPDETSGPAIRKLIETVQDHKTCSFLSVLKRCGPANPAPLSFLDKGYTLAMDIPNVGKRLRRLVDALDEVLLANGGRLYLAKDAMMGPELFRQTYPGLEKFLAVKARIDPSNRFTSAQAKRLGLEVHQ